MTDVVTVIQTVIEQVKVITEAPAQVVSAVSDAPVKVISIVTEGPAGEPYASAAAQAATEAARDAAIAAKIDAEAARTDILARISYGYDYPSGGSNGDIYFRIV